MEKLSENGYVIISDKYLIESVSKARNLFIETFQKKMSVESPIKNRELIKRFGDHPLVTGLYNSEYFLNLLQNDFKFEIPVKCGPTVTHYTSNDLTGNRYGLPYHQDYPSMASSEHSVVCWLNLVDSNEKCHGIEIIPGSHKKGLLKGEQTALGYVVGVDILHGSVPLVPSLLAGELLVMSPFLVHRTFVNQNFNGWKLSISQRFDDLNDEKWASRGYVNAYEVKVNREMYLKR